MHTLTSFFYHTEVVMVFVDDRLAVKNKRFAHEESLCPRGNPGASMECATILCNNCSSKVLFNFIKTHVQEVRDNEFLFLSWYIYHCPVRNENQKLWKAYHGTEMIFHGGVVVGICGLLLPSFGPKLLLIAIFPLVVCLAALTSRENSVL